MDCANESANALVLPGGDEIAPGASAKLTQKQAENHAVRLWIKRGWLVERKSKKAEAK